MAVGGGNLNTKGEMPDWVEDLAEAVVGAWEFKEPAYIHARYFEPKETAWGVGLLEMAPSARKAAQERGHGIIRELDLLLVDDAFEAVERMSFGFDANNRPCLTTKGQVEGGEIVLLIHAYPFEDDELARGVELA